ncbi:tetratricopeptide repeat protein [Planomonospora parontospora]|uniref:tetratricopeptide repeat protein n=1 Tax=Planomonospora parontospora TaxID=58119 RepID=UPI001670E627|nr:tetratricopeptide repeat protein [Planomonospora parontospora]GGL43470.1 hypothetical protein GCM10014719_51040 [Planomonospora parontospora subsp. antibiotica]GII18428.1 hypothetical protein Ppa05_51540 [Planomonospora parontospora subsp. antibiotica]
MDLEAAHAHLPWIVEPLRDLLRRAEAAGLEVQPSLPGLLDDPQSVVQSFVSEVLRLAEAFQQRGRAADREAAWRVIVALRQPFALTDPLKYADALGMLGEILTRQQRWEEALEVSEEAASVLRPHVADGEVFCGLYARAVRDCGTSLAELGRVAEAAAAKRDALRYYDVCLRSSPRYRPDVALTCHELFDLLMRGGEADEALEACDLAIGLMRELPTEFPQFRSRLALALRDRASALLRLGRGEEALEPGMEAIAAYRELVEEDRGHLPFLALALQLMSDPLSAADRDDEALETAAEAVRIAEELGPDSGLVRPLAWISYGGRLIERGLLMEAKEAYLAAVPNSEPLRGELAPALQHLSQLLAGEGRLTKAAAVAAVAARLYKLLVRDDPDWTTPQAGLLGWLAELDFRCGRYELALRNAERAVNAAEASGDRECLARAKGHLGSSLAGCGRHEEAERADREALELWQGLAEQDPETYRGPLGGAWNNLANKLGALGRTEEAAAAAQRSVELYERADLRHELANSLNGLAVRLHELGRDERARDAATRAVACYDRLIADEPRHLRNLAVVLHNLAGYHEALGDLERAWEAADRAAGIRHRLYGMDAEAFRDDLVLSLRRASDYASVLGRFDRAVHAASIRVEVAEAHGEPGVELAEALVDLGGLLTGVDRIEEAAETVEQAVELAAAIPEVPGLHAFYLDRLAWCRAELGHPEEAVRLARRGVALLEPIAGDDRDPHFPELGVLLGDLSGYLMACGRPIEALEAAGRAVSVRERLAAMDPGRFRPVLAGSLRRLGDVLAALGRQRPAEEARRRAEELAEPAD